MNTFEINEYAVINIYLMNVIRFLVTKTLMNEMNGRLNATSPFSFLVTYSTSVTSDFPVGQWLLITPQGNHYLKE